MAEKPFVLLIFKRSLAHYGIWCMLVCIGSDSDVAAVVEPRMMVYNTKPTIQYYKNTTTISVTN